MGNETKYLLNFLCLKRGAPDGDEGSGGGGGGGGGDGGDVSGAIVAANKKRKITTSTSMEVDWKCVSELWSTRVPTQYLW